METTALRRPVSRRDAPRVSDRPVNPAISATASESYEVVYGIGCDEYHDLDYGQFGDVWLDGSVSLEACAAAVKSYSACDDPEYFFYEWNGYCNCPTADASCSSGENQNAGGER